MAFDGERSIHVLSPFDGLTEMGFVRSTPVVARRTPGVVLATYEVLGAARVWRGREHAAYRNRGWIRTLVAGQPGG
jgi:hypothetical protein